MVQVKNLVYCATPSRIAVKKSEICDFVIKEGKLPFHPFFAFPYEFYEGNPEVGRDKTMAACLYALEFCSEFWLFGISDGTMQELVHAKKIGKPIRLFMEQFDPDGEEYYENLSEKYGDPLKDIEK